MLTLAEPPRVDFESASLSQIRHSISEGADITDKVATGF